MHDSKNKKCILFCRVSSRDQEITGYSLDSQKKLLTDYAKKQGFKISKTFSITETASKCTERKTYNEALKYVEKENVDCMVCEKIDRLTRNPKDAGVISDLVMGSNNREVHFVKENFILSKDTKSHDCFIWDMKVAVAHFYTNNLSEEVNKGTVEKAEQGWFPSKSPLGYVTTGEKGHKTHIIDNEKAPLVKKMFELYSSGLYTLAQLTKKINKMGLRNSGGGKVTKSRVHVYLQDLFYVGEFIWKEKKYSGKHEPLISKDLYNKVQEKLGRPTQDCGQYKKHLPVFKTMIRCEECGGTVAWTIQKGHWYGHCNHFKKCNQKKYIRQEKVEEQIFEQIKNIAPKNEKVLEWLNRAIKSTHKDSKEDIVGRRTSLNKQFEILDKRLEAMYLDKLDKKISTDFYKKKSGEFTKDKENILDELSKLEKENTAYYEAGYAIHVLASKAEQIYYSQKATAEDKRLLLSYIFSNHTLNSGKIASNYAPAFEFLAKWMPMVNKNFEPMKISLNNRKAETSASACSVWLRGRDSNPRPID